MKICHVCHQYFPQIGGIETWVKELSERSAKKGHQVEVICTDSTGQYPSNHRINGVDIKRFRTVFTPKNKYYFAPKIRSYLRHRDYELIHAHGFHSFPALLASFGSKNRPFIFSPYYHAKKNLLHRLYKIPASRLFKIADKVICISSFEMKLVQNTFDVSPFKIMKIPTGLDPKEFENIEPFPLAKKTLLYVGRLEESKRVQDIITVLPDLDDYQLIVIGKGKYEEKLREISEKLKVSERVAWLKNLPRHDLLRYYKSADVFLALSKYESYGITTAEALASGTPCIVATGSALEDHVDNHGCVGLEHPISAKSLKSAISKLLAIPRTVDHAPNKTWDDVTKEILKIYRECLS